MSFNNNFIKPNYYENEAWNSNEYVCGIDEVGRGCLAGPVVTCSCVLPINTKNNNLKDSKKLTKQQREKIYPWIIKNCFYSIAISDHAKIDKLNIYQTTRFSMEKSLIQLLNLLPFNKSKLKFVLTDAMPLDNEKLLSIFNNENLNQNFNPQFFHFSKGETCSQSIAAASIVAKVFRDNLMEKFANIIPNFDFQTNKGYGTKNHLNGLNNGKSVIHRKTFLKKILANKKVQKTIF